MSFFSLVPLPYRIGLVAVAIALLTVSAYVKGRKDVRAAWNAANAAAAVEQAKRQGEQDQREKMWEQAMTQAGRQYDERAKLADRSFDSSLDRLRNAYASGARLREPAEPAGSCPEPSRIDADAVLRAGEAVAAMARDADKAVAALQACVAAFPR